MLREREGGGRDRDRERGEGGKEGEREREGEREGGGKERVREGEYPIVATFGHTRNSKRNIRSFSRLSFFAFKLSFVLI